MAESSSAPPVALFFALVRSRVAILATFVSLTGLIAAAVARLIPWAMFFLSLFGGVGGLVAWSYVREWWAARKDRQLEEGLGAQHQGVIGKAKVRDREALKEMEVKWKQGVARLRESKVGLYLLPWYVIIGAPACGKTTAIANSGLRFPLGDSKLKGRGGTRNCDWFFAEEAILLDTAGRYTFDDDGAPDKDEWLGFLKLLKKFRPLAPINGLIVAVSAEDLLTKESDEIAEMGRMIRAKLDELVHELGIQFPVYVLCTKCDLIEGFTDYFSRMPKRRLDEMLGWTNPTWEMRDPERLVADALQGLRQRIESMRPRLLSEEERVDAARRIFVFPEEVREFQEGLTAFCDVLFRETRYNESPFLRGIYLTSGLQRGTTISRMLMRLGVRLGATELREEKKSYFLKEFFGGRLPADRNLVVTTGSVRGKVQVFNNLGLAAIAALCVLVGVLTGGSYVQNRTLLLHVGDEVDAAASSTQLPGNERVAALGRFVDALERLEDRNRHRPWTSGLGLYTGYRAIEPARALFVSRFDRDAFAPASEGARRAVKARDLETGFGGVEALIRNRYLSKLLNHTVEQAPGPNDPLVRFWPNSGTPDETLLDAWGRGYAYFLRWRDGSVASREQNDDLELLREALPGMYTVERVAQWADRKYPEVRADQLPAPLVIANGARVRGGFTPKAWSERIQPLSEAVALVEDEIDPQLTVRFRTDFLRRYFTDWLQFLTLPRDVADSALPAATLLGEKTPYLLIVDRVTEAAKLEVAEDEKPAWTKTVARIAADRPAYLGHLQALLTQTKASEGDPAGAVEAAKQIFQRPPTLVTSYKDDAAAPPDPFGKAEFWVLKAAMSEPAANPDDDAARGRVAALLRAPIYEAFGYYTRTVYRELNRQWQTQVVAAARSGGGDEQAIYCRPTGAVWVFDKDFVQPFVEQPGYVPKTRYTKRVPFTSNFGAFLRQAEQRCRTAAAAGAAGPGGAGAAGAGGGAAGAGAGGGLPIFAAIPTKDPEGGGARATRTVLTLFCESGEWSLEHHQFPATKQGPKATGCNRAELTVYVGNEAGDEHPLAPMVVEGVPGPDNAVVQLLRRARRSGAVYSWDIAGYVPQFRVTGMDPAPPPPAPPPPPPPNIVPGSL